MILFYKTAIKRPATIAVTLNNYDADEHMHKKPSREGFFVFFSFFLILNIEFGRYILFKINILIKND